MFIIKKDDYRLTEQKLEILKIQCIRYQWKPILMKRNKESDYVSIQLMSKCFYSKCSFSDTSYFFLIILPAVPHPLTTMAGWTHQKHAVCQNGSLQEGAVELPPYAEHLLHLREKNGVDTSADLHPCLCLPHGANKTKQKLNYTKQSKTKSEK